ncbi:hypothetical protein [Pseudoruegeria sp. HB172150]|uniref:hypothetical protein n=1 Tax=Pseudoruegeria sp. HB172150 TaxID=2721164 RepID=UPI001C13055C|nr:hypothetical protein [Pseudoruegeria sp. HB172150]
MTGRFDASSALERANPEQMPAELCGIRTQLPPNALNGFWLGNSCERGNRLISTMDGALAGPYLSRALSWRKCGENLQTRHDFDKESDGG